MTAIQHEIEELTYLEDCIQRARTRRDELRIDSMEEFIRQLANSEYIQS